jgi:glyoxylase-like metal-dependent hydrolase (beta-lactamase superfamily II)
MSIPFNRDYPFEYATVETLAPGLRRVVARNPGPFTFHGTATFILGRGEVVVIDPGPAEPSHVQALLDALDGETVSHILVTHTHRDHSPATRCLKRATGAPSYAYGPHGAGKLEQGVQVEEGGDMSFVPDHEVRDGDVIDAAGMSFECVYTPGHTSNHMCFAHRESGTLFTGDHVMGWNTTIVSPPDGDMGQYMASLDKLLRRDDRLYRPTHGPAISDPAGYVQACLSHREQRVEEVLHCLRDGVHRIHAMVPQIYRELPHRMRPAAARSVFATVLYLVELGRARCHGELAVDAHFEAIA